MAISSQFHKDMSKIQSKSIGGLTKRQIIMVVGVGTASLIGVGVSLLGFPTYAELVLILPIIVPSVLYGTDKYRWLKRVFQFETKEQERYYKTNRIRRYSYDEFTEKQGTKEINETKKKKA